MNQLPARLRPQVAAVMLVAVGLLAMGATTAAAAPHRRAGHPRRVRIGSAPVLPIGTTPVAGIASSRPLSVTVALRPRSQAAMARYALAVANPRSPYYHRYLTTAQFRRRFAPTAATIRRLELSLRRHGLRPGALNPDGLGLHVRASSGALERAFSITLARVRTATGRVVAYATRGPAFDWGVAHTVQAVIGLNGFARQSPQLLRPSTSSNPFVAAARRALSRAPQLATGGPQPTSSCRLPANAPGYTANQIAGAYGFSGLYQHGDLGRGVTVALYELEPNLRSDIAAYQSCYGTHARVSYVRIDGGSPPDPNLGGPAGLGEAALDIEQVVGLAPRANVLVYQGPNNSYGPYDVTASIVNQNRAAFVSSSWGDCEALVGAPAVQAEGALFAEATIQGQAWFAAAGDSGSTDCYGAGVPNLDTSLAVDDPGSQPFVTSVGGTTITQLSPSLTETAWNDGSSPQTGPGAGGGGLSGLWAMPSYQRNAARSLGVIRAGVSTLEGCGPTTAVPTRRYCREVPDVSADADPNSGYLIYYNGTNVTPQPSGWQGIGGTSAAAPLWAALMADANSSSACRSRIGFANGALYHLAGQSEATYFHDVTAGNNDATGTSHGLFAAAAGYDMATGLGTPVASSIGPALCSQAVRLTTPGPRRNFAWQPVHIQLHAILGRGVSGPLHYGARHLPMGVRLNATTGTITGRPIRVGTRAVTVDAYTSSQIYGSARFIWDVQARPKVRHISLLYVRSGRPRLSFTVTAGRHEPMIRRLRVALPPGLGPTSRLGLLQVLNRHRYLVRRRVFHRGRTVTITLAQRMRVLTLVFNRGSLYATRAIRRDAGRRRPKPLRLEVTPVDGAGGSVLLRPSVRPQG